MEAKSVINWIGAIVVISIIGMVTLLALGKPADGLMTLLMGFVGSAIANLFLALNVAQTKRKLDDLDRKVDKL